MSNHLLTQIYKSRKNILDILDTRGFDTSDYNNFSFEELHVMIQNQQLDFIVKHKVYDKKIYIKYNITKVLRPNIIYDIIEDLFHIDNILSNKDDLIIINKDEPNETLHNTVKSIWLNDSIYISLLNIERLQFNILNHTLVPKHTILNEKEKEEFMNRYNITNTKMIPTISYFSPVSLVLGIRPGDICHIERFSKTSINSNFYRICIL
tara:strand:- start:12026 stop:12649 length:624 start_codon:yes stop_codon:yes gene_type:complete